MQRDRSCLAEAPPMTRIRICCVVNFTREWRDFHAWMKRVNAPVTMVTSVPWEREWDITKNSPLWELLPFNLSFLHIYYLEKTWKTHKPYRLEVSSVKFPFELSRDITENSPLWELLPFNLSWSPIGSRQSRWPGLWTCYPYHEISWKSSFTCITVREWPDSSHICLFVFPHEKTYGFAKTWGYNTVRKTNYIFICTNIGLYQWQHWTHLSFYNIERIKVYEKFFCDRLINTS